MERRGQEKDIQIKEGRFLFRVEPSEPYSIIFDSEGKVPVVHQLAAMKNQVNDMIHVVLLDHDQHKNLRGKSSCVIAIRHAQEFILRGKKSVEGLSPKKRLIIERLEIGIGYCN